MSERSAKSPSSPHNHAIAGPGTGPSMSGQQGPESYPILSPGYSPSLSIQPIFPHKPLQTSQDLGPPMFNIPLNLGEPNSSLQPSLVPSTSIQGPLPNPAQSAMILPAGGRMYSTSLSRSPAPPHFIMYPPHHPLASGAKPLSKVTSTSVPNQSHPSLVQSRGKTGSSRSTSLPNDMSASRMDTPTSKMDTPTSRMDTPTNKMDTPTNKMDTPTSKMDTLTSKMDIPTSKMDTPTSRMDTPTNKMDIPTNKMDTPTNKMDISSSRVVPPSSYSDSECPSDGKPKTLVKHRPAKASLETDSGCSSGSRTTTSDGVGPGKERPSNELHNLAKVSTHLNFDPNQFLASVPSKTSANLSDHPKGNSVDGMEDFSGSDGQSPTEVVRKTVAQTSDVPTNTSDQLRPVPMAVTGPIISHSVKAGDQNVHTAPTFNILAQEAQKVLLANTSPAVQSTDKGGQLKRTTHSIAATAGSPTLGRPLTSHGSPQLNSDTTKGYNAVTSGASQHFNQSGMLHQSTPSSSVTSSFCSSHSLNLHHPPRTNSTSQAHTVTSPTSTPSKPGILQRKRNSDYSTGSLHLPKESLKTGDHLSQPSASGGTTTSDFSSPRKKPRKQNHTPLSVDHYANSISDDTGANSLECDLEDMPSSPDHSSHPSSEEKLPDSVVDNDRTKPNQATRRLFKDDTDFETQLRCLAELKRPPVLAGQKINSKAAHCHFWRYSDFRTKEQSKPSVVSIAKKRNTILRVKGWRIGRISEDLDKMVDIEKETVTVLQRVKGCLKELAADSSNAEDKELLNRIVQGDYDRSKNVMSCLQQTQNSLKKILGHKSNITDLVRKCAPDTFSLTFIRDKLHTNLKTQ